MKFRNLKISRSLHIQTWKSYKIIQNNSITWLQKLEESANFEDLLSVRAHQSWLTHTRLDISAATNKLQQVMEDFFDSKYVKDYNK